MGTVTRDALGAWLVRCNPLTWDLAAYVAAGHHSIGTWSVRDNYRSAMMRRGDRIVFWVSGSDRTYARGIWGIGLVTGHPEGVVNAPDDVGFWMSESARLGVTDKVFVDIALMEVPLTDRELRAHGVDDLEVQRQPFGSNPSWINQRQMARIDDLVDNGSSSPGDVPARRVGR